MISIGTRHTWVCLKMGPKSMADHYRPNLIPLILNIIEHPHCMVPCFCWGCANSEGTKMRLDKQLLNGYCKSNKNWIKLVVFTNKTPDSFTSTTNNS